MSSDSALRLVTTWEFAGLIARPISRITLMLACVTGAGVVMGLAAGWSARASILVLGGAVRGSALLVPFGVSLFLTFYEGFWEGRLLFTHFGFGTLFLRLASIYIGFRLATRLAELSDILKHLSEGRLVVRD